MLDARKVICTTDSQHRNQHRVRHVAAQGARVPESTKRTAHPATIPGWLRTNLLRLDRQLVEGKPKGDGSDAEWSHEGVPQLGHTVRSTKVFPGTHHACGHDAHPMHIMQNLAQVRAGHRGKEGTVKRGMRCRGYLALRTRW